MKGKIKEGVNCSLKNRKILFENGVIILRATRKYLRTFPQNTYEWFSYCSAEELHIFLQGHRTTTQAVMHGPQRRPLCMAVDLIVSQHNSRDVQESN